MRSSLIIIFLSVLLGCQSREEVQTMESKNLRLEKLSEHTYLHISYLDTEDYGKVACNGMLVVDQGEAIVYDTPVDDATANELIDWVNNELKCKIKAVVGTHFHKDCIGGLQAFHKKGIPSYSSFKTIELARADSLPAIPQRAFRDSLALTIGSLELEQAFLGAGHAPDNIVAYVANDQVLFGGCLIKSMGASKGYLGDADTLVWPTTVAKVKSKFNEAHIIIPGHGKTGGQELLDYTMELFSTKKSNLK